MLARYGSHDLMSRTYITLGIEGAQLQFAELWKGWTKLETDYQWLDLCDKPR